MLLDGLLVDGSYLIVTGSVNTWIAFAFVDILFTIQTDDTRNANTFIAGINQINIYE